MMQRLDEVEDCDASRAEVEAKKSSLSIPLQRVFDFWNDIYSPDFSGVSLRLFDIVENTSLKLGEDFLVAFLTLCERWADLSFEQFCCVFEVMDYAFNKRKLVSDAGSFGANLILLYLMDDLRDSPEKFKLLAEVLVAEGYTVAQNFIFLLKRAPDFMRIDCLLEALAILKAGSIYCADLFLQACDSWNLDLAVAKKLSANVVFLMNQPDGVSKCTLLLEGSPPSIFELN